MKFVNVAGARVIEALTSGLYDGNSNCIREYVQNAVDSHSDIVEIEHLNNEQDIRIRDYGEGMDRDQLVDALKFGYSKTSSMVLPPRYAFIISSQSIVTWSFFPPCFFVLI